MDDAGGCLGYLVGIALILFVLYYVVLLLAQVALVVGGVMGTAGVAYGGGQACRNYVTAFKRNVIDSNRA